MRKFVLISLSVILALILAFVGIGVYCIYTDTTYKDFFTVSKWEFLIISSSILFSSSVRFFNSFSNSFSASYTSLCFSIVFTSLRFLIMKGNI